MDYYPPTEPEVYYTPQLVSLPAYESKDKDIQLGVHSIMPVPPGPTPNPSKKAYGFTPSGPPAECDYPQNPAPNRQRCATYK